MTCIEARGLRKAFGTTVALEGLNLRIEEGRILGLIGPNGAGKTTALNAILGLTAYEGELSVLGRDPWKSRELLMREVSFIADVAVLPRWMRVSRTVTSANSAAAKKALAATRKSTKSTRSSTKAIISCNSNIPKLLLNCARAHKPCRKLGLE